MKVKNWKISKKQASQLYKVWYCLDESPLDKALRRLFFDQLGEQYMQAKNYQVVDEQGKPVERFSLKVVRG